MWCLVFFKQSTVFISIFGLALYQVMGDCHCVCECLLFVHRSLSYRQSKLIDARKGKHAAIILLFIFFQSYFNKIEILFLWNIDLSSR
jgi:hypothetical protein